MGATSSAVHIGFFSTFVFFFYLILTGLGVYCLVLFIRLAHRGIRALDLYIEEKTKSRL
ncbi:hypothetical protein [Paenibacillus sp. HJGM_3]|uniref:hypothetical protein n=1 Tax=Paenibacillus sp. HJGM_3 TaxID=3379816 RepID=UPI00385C0C3C